MNVYETKNMGALLGGNSYGGRGIVIGRTEDGCKAAIAYFIMGRSENSRNRVFVEEGETVIIRPFDVSKMEDPSLIIYAPVKRYEDKLIVTNGDQTDTIYEFLKRGESFEAALDTREFEPDAPNYTPRISGMLELSGEFNYKLSILKSGDEKGGCCNRYIYKYKSEAGLGHYLHTYMGDGSPLPTFVGEPERVKIPKDIDEWTESIWAGLDSENKISLYVRYTDLKSGAFESRLINKNERIE